MNQYVIFLLIQACLTWIMIGIIWYTQIIHYPLYSKIKEGFVEYERAHIKRTSFIFAPLMFTEVVTAILLLGHAPGGLLTILATINLIFLIFVWLSTFLFQIHQHHKLAVRFSEKLLNRLISTNWIRTIFWSLKGLIMILMLYFTLRI